LDTDGSGFIFADSAARFDLAVRTEGSRRFARMPAFATGYSIPAIAGSGELAVIDRDGSDSIFAGFDAQLGGTWFASRVWRFDYAAGRLTLLARGISMNDATADVTFERLFPRVRVSVDGHALTMSYDSAASIADPANGGAAAVRATSFIPRATFARWRAANPTWPSRVIAAGIQTIRVPRISIGAVTLENVEFSTRADDDVFSGDTVEGKLGANVFAHRAVVVDYPGARLQIEPAAVV
jgi:hypothetical protein